VPRIGGDIAEMNQLRRTFDKHSKTVDTLTRDIGRHVDGAWWIGPAAERFKGQWRSEFAPTLRKLERALDEAGRHVDKRREAIERAGS
jgi:uncharacterized protein YukE